MLRLARRTALVRSAAAPRAASVAPAAARAMGGAADRSMGEYWAEFKDRTKGLPRSEYNRVATEMKEQYLAEHHHEEHTNTEIEFTDENYPVSRNPGGKSGAMPTDAEQATGPEYEEVTAGTEGELLFSRDPLTGAFGTMDAPVLVPSSFNERIVGCLGGPNEGTHPLLWFTLYRGRKHACPRCGQVFQLVDATGDMAEAKEAAQEAVKQ